MITPFAFWQSPTAAVIAGATYGRIFAARFVTTDTRPFYSDTEFATYLTASTTVTNQSSFMNTIHWNSTNSRYVMCGAGIAQSTRLAYSTDGSNGASFTYSADPLNVISGNSRRYAIVYAGGSFNRFLVGGFNNIIQSATGASFSTFVNDASIIKNYPVTYGGYNGGMLYNSTKDHVLIYYGDAAASTSNITVCTMSAGSPTFSQATHLSSTIASVVWCSAATPEPYYHSVAAYTSTTASAVTSTDGLNWTYRGSLGTIIPVTGALPAHCYSPELDRILFYFRSGNVYTQPFACATASSGPTFSITTNITRCVAMASNDYGITEAMWCKEISKFVAIDNRNTQVYTSADGFTWTIRVVAAVTVGVGFAGGIP